MYGSPGTMGEPFYNYLFKEAASCLKYFFRFAPDTAFNASNPNKKKANEPINPTERIEVNSAAKPIKTVNATMKPASITLKMLPNLPIIFMGT